MAAFSWLVSFAETLLLVATGFCGMIVSICVALARNGFDGNCILFSEVKWCNDTALNFTYLGKRGSCHFIIVSEVLIAFYALFYAIYHVCYLVERMKEYHRLMLPAIVANSVCLICIFVSACLLSIGFRRFCKSYVSGFIGTPPDDFSCSTVPSWNQHPKCGEFPEHKDFTSNNYYQLFTTSQGAAWFGFLFWCLATAGLVARRIMYKPSVGDPTTSDKAPITGNIVI
ncbi:hypothetical protein HOLleu_08225 [Holothuria leucospilota]|uniref:Transmembrane protein 179B n=1 Tax=Holothuria leucospilota TaxID=206669 RepID=A0A9Q1HGS1_HOLLE|nr:hypothetical protein HOLleu_08225 [Holothuria leucospilota]